LIVSRLDKLLETVSCDLRQAAVMNRTKGRIEDCSLRQRSHRRRVAVVDSRPL